MSSSAIRCSLAELGYTQALIRETCVRVLATEFFYLFALTENECIQRQRHQHCNRSPMNTFSANA